MPWIVGIDEAGYGPNLGPFVMSAAACRVPECHATADLWDLLQAVARRHTDPPDQRMVVADSKLVYSPGRGLAALEQTVHVALHGSKANCLADFVDCVCPDCHAEVRREFWYDGATALPVEADADDCRRAGQAFADLCTNLGIEWRRVKSVVVCPAAFNSLLDRWDTKGAVLASSLVRLLRALPSDDEPVSVFIDKHGGRNNYAATLQPAFDGGLVLARREGSLCSEYEVLDGNRRIAVTIEPRADINHFCVALASMTSKYLRELLMLEFNRFWKAKLPDLKPTAGYPADSRRFWTEIRKTVRKLGLKKEVIWRDK